MVKIDFDYYAPYQEWKERVLSDFETTKRYATMAYGKDGFKIERFERDYLNRHANLQYDERDRFAIVITLVCFLLDYYKLSEVLSDEFDMYYMDYAKGLFANLFTKEEHAQIVKDLESCHKKIHPDEDPELWFEGWDPFS